jgi:hypothetical protein
MLAQKRHADERIDFGRFDLDGSLATCAAARLTVGCGNVSAG